MLCLQLVLLPPSGQKSINTALRRNNESKQISSLTFLNSVCLISLVISFLFRTRLVVIKTHHNTEISVQQLNNETLVVTTAQICL